MQGRKEQASPDVLKFFACTPEIALQCSVMKEGAVARKGPHLSSDRDEDEEKGQNS